MYSNIYLHPIFTFQVNQTLMAMKEAEYKAGIQQKPFPPAMHFFHAKPLIDKSDVFDVIKMMPKGQYI